MWDTGAGQRTDAFKTGQEPGASGPVIGGGEAPADGLAVSTSGPGIGVDSGVGGLY